MTKCKCTQGWCCDSCWRLSAKEDPCKVSGCKNPSHHSGPHGKFNNTNDPIVLTAEDLGPGWSIG